MASSIAGCTSATQARRLQGICLTELSAAQGKTFAGAVKWTILNHEEERHGLELSSQFPPSERHVRSMRQSLMRTSSPCTSSVEA